MAEIRINGLANTAQTASNDDYVVLDGATNGTRKMLAKKLTEGVEQQLATTNQNVAQNTEDITDLKADIRQKTGLSEEAKVALLSCFEHVAWIDEHGQTYYNNLYDALYPESDLVRLEAVFTQGSAVIYPATPLDDLKAYLTVTGYYNDGTSGRVTDYALLGTLTVGTSTVTVMKDGKTATFNVVVSDYPIIRVFRGKGTSGTTIVDRENRMLSEQIPFVNAIPITMQITDKGEFRYGFKNIEENGEITTTFSCFPDQIDYRDSTVYLNPWGWAISETQQTKGILSESAPEGWEPTAFDNSSGYFRLLFADIYNIQNALPSDQVSGYLTVQGTTYKLVTRPKEEFE